MYLEGSRRFLLSAKLFEDGTAYISQHDDFPLIESRPFRGFVAQLMRHLNGASW